METFRFDFAAGTWWTYVLAVLVAVFISILYYRTTIPPISDAWRRLLISLRTVGLALLLLTLFEPLLRLTRSEKHTPRIAIAVDVSKSAGIKDRTVQRSAVMRSVYQRLRSELASQADVVLFDETVRPFTLDNPDSLTFRGYRTDIASPIRYVANASVDDRYGAIVLITDGNHNYGEQPVYAAERSGLGVYVVGVGDTLSPVDVSVDAMTAPGMAVANEQVSVNVDVRQSNLSDQQVTVILKDNDAEVARQQVTLRSMIPQSRTTFEWVPKGEGIHKLSAEVSSITNEFTSANNKQQAFVRVRKNKRKVLLVAGAPSVDVTFLKTAIEQDPSVEVVTRIQKDAATFYEGPFDGSLLQDLQAIVLIGFPTALAQQPVLDKIAERARRTSLLFVTSSGIDMSKLSALSDVLPFRVRSFRPQEVSVSPDVTGSAMANPVMKLTGQETDVETWNNLPPIYRPEMFVDPTPGASVLSKLKVGTAQLDEPLIVASQRGSVRTLAVLGHGLFRWKLMAHGQALSHGRESVDALQLFVGNSVKWLSSPDDEKRVAIRSTHEHYTVGETVGFVASVQDQSLSNVDGAEVKVEIVGSTSSSSVVLSGLGNGQYSSSIGMLPPGDYSYKGTARAKGVEIGSDNGRFTVSNVGVEDAAVTMNSSLLRVLTQRSGGQLVRPDDVDRLLDAIRKDSRLKPITRTSDREYALYHLPWLIAAALSAFATEWFLRKRKGLV